MQNIVYIQVQPATNFLKLLKARKPPIWGIDGLSLTEVLTNNSSHITNYMWIFLHIVLCLGVFFTNNTLYLTMFDVHLVPNTVYLSAGFLITLETTQWICSPVSIQIEAPTLAYNVC